MAKGRKRLKRSCASSNRIWFASAVAMYCSKPRDCARIADPEAVRAAIRLPSTRISRPATTPPATSSHAGLNGNPPSW